MFRNCVLTTVAFLMLSAAVTTAQTPMGTDFTYQGRLNAEGSPANGAYEMQFTLWDDPVAGAEVGPTLIFDGLGGNPAPIDVLDGLFTVALDFGVAPYDGNALWLEVTVSGTPLLPRQTLSGTPFSLATRGIHVDGSGNVGIGTATPASLLEVSSNNPTGTVLRISNPAHDDNRWSLRANGADGGGASAYSFQIRSEYWNAARISIDDAGQVGIATITPGRRLDVVTQFAGDGVRAVGAAGTAPCYVLSNAGADQFALGLATADGNYNAGAVAGDIVMFANSGRLLLRTQNNNNGVTLDAAGRVGIATATPGRRLDLVAAYNGDGVRVVGGASSAPAYVLSNDGTDQFALGLATAPSHYNGNAVAGDVVLFANSGRLLLRTADDNNGITVQNGRVGIGSNSPTTRLHVNGGTDNSVRITNANRNPWSMLVRNETAPTEVGMFVENNGTLWINDDQVTGFGSGTGYAVLQFDGSWTTGSDERLKSDVQPMGDVLENVLALRPVSFVYNGITPERRAERSLGFIAQEVEPLFPELVYTTPESRAGTDMKSMNYAGMSVVAIEALQELHQRTQAQNTALQNRVHELENENVTLSRRLESLESRLEAMEAAKSGRNGSGK